MSILRTFADDLAVFHPRTVGAAFFIVGEPADYAFGSNPPYALAAFPP